MARRLVLALVMLLGAACGSAGGESDDSDAAVTDGSDTTAAPSAGPASTSVPRRTTAPDSTTATAAGPRRATTTTPASSGGSTVTTQPDPVAVGRGGTGTYARTLLRPSPASAITLEVISHSDARVRAESIAYLDATMSDVTKKPVAVSTRTVDAETSSSWSDEAIVDFAMRHAAKTATADHAVLHVVGLPGSYAPRETVLGVAVRGNIFAVFPDRVASASSPIVSAAMIEKALVVHEAGHVLGLVDLALDRDRDDPEHPHHSGNRGSVMYWAVEADVVGHVLGGPPSTEFDADDLADLAAMRNGA